MVDLNNFHTRSSLKMKLILAIVALFLTFWQPIVHAALLRGGDLEKRSLAVHVVETFEFNHLNLTEKHDLFRCKLDKNATTNKLMLWMENRRTKDQWEAPVEEDVTTYGPSGVPHHALFHFLEKALGKYDIGGVASADDTPLTKADVVVAVLNNGHVSISLTLTMSALWSNEYKFLLSPKTVEPIEVLASRLHDAEETINRLIVLTHKKPLVKVSGYNAYGWAKSVEYLISSEIEEDNNFLEFSDATVEQPQYFSTMTFTRDGVYRAILASPLGQTTVLIGDTGVSLAEKMQQTVQIFKRGTRVIAGGSAYGRANMAVLIEVLYFLN